MNLLTRLRAAWAAFTAPQPLPFALMAPTIIADAFPALATPMQLGEASKESTVSFDTVETTTELYENRTVASAKPKPKRKRAARKPKVLLAAPDTPDAPPQPDWLRKLREKRRIIHNEETAKLPESVSVALTPSRTIYRQLGESTTAFVARVRATVGVGHVDWAIEKPDSTRLEIIENALHRPLKASTDVLGWDDILPEDFANMQGTHGTVQ